MKKPIQPEQLKEAMRTWTTGVAIVTGYHGIVTHGMTANSFNSLALTPPTVLVALRHHTRTQRLVEKGRVFGVNILAENQLSLAKRFAGQSDNSQDRFSGVETFSMVTKAPMIKGSMANLDCKVVKAFNVGDTMVFIGEVLATQKDIQYHQPLLYLNREWRKLAK